MQGILAIELKGFTKLADSLAMKMENLELTPERVRVSTIGIIQSLIDNLITKHNTNEDHYIGGDTFFITFSSLSAAIEFATEFLHNCTDIVLEKGLFYIKPNLCVGYGEIKTQGARFYDNTSIDAYRVADKVPPFSLWASGKSTVSEINRLNKFAIKHVENDELLEIDWKNNNQTIEDLSIPEIKIPTLLLENEIIFSSSISDSMSKITSYQDEAKSILAFGGPVPFNAVRDNEYLKKVIADIKSENKKWNVISYLEKKNRKSSFYWLELARRLQSLYPKNYSFTAYIIPENVLIPFSYQIFDDQIVHLGLRSYSLEHDRATMSASIIFKSARIAERYKDEFSENYRKLRKFNDKDFVQLIADLGEIDSYTRTECMRIVDDLLK